MSELFTNKVIAWNAARRDRMFDFDLCCKMLGEEIDELFKSDNTIEKMDAIGDIVFVAIGELWKIGIHHDDIARIMYFEDLTLFEGSKKFYDYSNFIRSVVLEGIYEAYKDNPLVAVGFDYALNSIFMVALPAAAGLGVKSIFYDICHAICDSNNTKKIVKVGSTVKSSKGPNFIPPTGKLTNLLEMLHGANKNVTSIQ